MAYRFGRSHWQDADRLNLLNVCLAHQQWDKRLQLMREIYAADNYPPGYFTENSCREELERIMALPTPNLRVNVSDTFVYSRKIMMEKWIEHFTAEVRNLRSSQAEIGLVNVRNNVKLMQEALNPDISESRLQEIMQLVKQSAEPNKNDGAYKRTVGSLESAIMERMQQEGTMNLETLVLPPSKPPGDDVNTGSRGFLTPTHSTPSIDMSFFSPPPPAPRPMCTLIEAVRDAAPVVVPLEKVVVPITDVQDAFSLPDDIMEPSPLSSIKEPKIEEIDKESDDKDKENPVPPNCPKKQAVPEASKHSQKKEEPTPVEIKIAEIKEEEEATPSPSPTPTLVATVPSTRGRGRPRIYSNAVNSVTKKSEKDEKSVGIPRAGSPEIPAPAKKRNKETSQEPSASTSKKVRSTPMVTRRRKEDTPSSRMSSVPPMVRSESSFDFQTAPASPMYAETNEIEVQTDITIRQAIQDVSMGERRRSHAPPVFRKGRKSQVNVDGVRSVSRNSSVSTPGPRSDSVVRNPVRSIGCQTNIRFDIEKDELIVLRVDSQPNYFPRVVELDSNKAIIISFETCKEIAAENATLSENYVEIGKRAAKVDGKREVTVIVECDDAIGQRLVEEKSYQVVSASSDLPSTGLNDSPVKRHRRDDKAKEDMMKVKLLAMYRHLHDCEWAEAFKKPVPLGEATYDQGVLERIDLSMIKKEIESGTISTEAGFLLRAYRMLSNAVMYNGYDHDVHLQARSIVENIMVDIQSVSTDEKRGVSSNKVENPSDVQSEDSRATSVDPQSVATVANVGTKRSVFRKGQNVEGVMTTSGSRKGKKNTK